MRHCCSQQVCGKKCGVSFLLISLVPLPAHFTNNHSVPLRFLTRHMPSTLPNFQKSVKNNKSHITDLGVFKCRHSQKTLELFTPKSNFYCRKLPPLGVRACNLNGAREMNFVVQLFCSDLTPIFDDALDKRERLGSQISRTSFTGPVDQLDIWYSYRHRCSKRIRTHFSLPSFYSIRLIPQVGSFAKRYIVKSQCVGTGSFTITGHLYFLLEIWPTCYYPPPPPIAPEDYFKRRECAVRRYPPDFCVGPG